MWTKRLSILALAATALACMPTCTEEPEPVIIKHEVVDSAYIKGELNGQSNYITGTCLLACTQGLATGTYFTGLDRITNIWNSSYTVVDTLIWTGPQWITKTGDNGTCDSVVFTTTWQTLEGVPDIWVLVKATLGKTGGSALIAQHTGTLGTAYGGDQVRNIWEISFGLIPSGSSHDLTDTLAWIVIQGIANNSASAAVYIDFIYANGDTNRRSATYSYSQSPDTQWARVNFLAQDTLRAADTCLARYLVTASGKCVAWDTLNIVIPENGALEHTGTIELIRWPD